MPDYWKHPWKPFKQQTKQVKVEIECLIFRYGDLNKSFTHGF